MIGKIDLTDVEKGILVTALQLFSASLNRQMQKYPTGSALHNSFSASRVEVSELQNKIFSLKG